MAGGFCRKNQNASFNHKTQARLTDGLFDPDTEFGKYEKNRLRVEKFSLHLNILIASGHPVSTIRLENLRIGSTDLKYMAKLAEVLKQPDTQDKTLRAEAERFLKETPERVGITLAHDPSARAEAREKAIDLILKLTGQPKH